MKVDVNVSKAISKTLLRKSAKFASSSVRPAPMKTLVFLVTQPCH